MIKENQINSKKMSMKIQSSNNKLLAIQVGAFTDHRNAKSLTKNYQNSKHTLKEYSLMTNIYIG